RRHFPVLGVDAGRTYGASENPLPRAPTEGTTLRTPCGPQRPPNLLRRRSSGLSRNGSDVEAELHHVAVLHDVLLALHAGLALGAGLGDGAALDQVAEGDDLRLDEALLEVGVDDTGGLGGGGALLDRPGAGFLRAGREVRLQAEGVEADARSEEHTSELQSLTNLVCR